MAAALYNNIRQSAEALKSPSLLLRLTLSHRIRLRERKGQHRGRTANAEQRTHSPGPASTLCQVHPLE